MVKNLPVMQETPVQSLGQEDPVEKKTGKPLQYSCLGKPIDRRAWLATVLGATRVVHDLVTKPPPITLNALEINFLRKSLKLPYFALFCPQSVI